MRTRSILTFIALMLLTSPSIGWPSDPPPVWESRESTRPTETRAPRPEGTEESGDRAADPSEINEPSREPADSPPEGGAASAEPDPGPGEMSQDLERKAEQEQRQRWLESIWNSP